MKHDLMWMKPTKCTKAILDENSNDSVVRISNQVLLRPHTNVSKLVPPQIILSKHVLYCRGMIHIPAPVYPNYHRKSNSSFEFRNKYTWNKSFSHKNSRYIDNSDILNK